MTLRLVLRTLAARPVRTAVLSGGFGFGVAVMAALLGVGDVILEQSRSPALRGGGDLVVVGRAGDVSSARFLLSSVLGAPPLATRVATASPTQRRTLFLVEGDRDCSRITSPTPSSAAMTATPKPKPPESTAVRTGRAASVRRTRRRVTSPRPRKEPLGGRCASRAGAAPAPPARGCG